MVDVKNSRWFIEYFTPYEAHMHGIREYLVIEETDYQVVEIAKTYNYGKCLLLDGKMQSSEIDEYIYHEVLVHPAMVSHPNPRKVLIIGGGEGATLREVLKHSTVEQAIMIDIDRRVVELCREYLPEWHQGAFDDKKVRLLYQDGRKFLEESEERFDVIIIDISEPIEHGPAYLLYTKEFYGIVSKRLNDDGVISLQAGSTSCRDPYLHTAIYKTLTVVFPIVKTHQAFIPSFDTPWGFALASKTIDFEKIGAEEIDRRIKERVRDQLRYYDGLTHSGMFILPKSLRDALARQLDIIEDEKPVFVIF